MKRLAPIAVAALLLLVTDQVSAAPASHWAQLNEALTPPSLALRDDAATLANDIADAGTTSQGLFFTSLFKFKTEREQMAKLGKQLDAIQADLKAVKQDGFDGIDALDRFAVETCFAHFWATELRDVLRVGRHCCQPAGQPEPRGSRCGDLPRGPRATPAASPSASPVESPK